MDNIKYSPEMAQTLADAMNWLNMKGHTPVITIHVRTFDEKHHLLDALAVSIAESWQIDRFAQQWRDYVADAEAAEKIELIESEDA